MKSLTVNEALSQKDHIHGHCIEVEGLLVYEFENVSIRHWPKAQQTPDFATGVWIDAEGAFSFDDEVMRRWAGKRVVVLGIFESSPPQRFDGGHNGFGHWGLWPARMRARPDGSV
ncbi:hypothetical protein AYO49_05510 [Verrucomicrobiaceae bacterium SCGC AG-212-N21]|nr:hypothetical protein AYO49_05510 [Verrucomicrobiaceae bacterium SCGC AG-212-N21]